MPNRGKFIGNDNLYVPDAPTIGDATAGDAQVSVTFTAPSDVGNDDITAYGASATDGTNVIGATGSSSPVTVTGLTNGTSYTAQVWAINDYGNGPLSAATASFSPALPPLGVFMGGSGNGEATIDFITITSAGNAQDFGDLAGPIERGGGYSSSTRAVYVGGYPSNSGASNPHNTMSYVTMRSTGNATDFGDLTYSPREPGTASDDVRGITYSGWINGNTNTNIIDYTTIPTTGNATDFGDSATPRSGITNNINSPTRGVFAGGYSESGGNRNTIDYVTIPSAGNSSDFGDLTGAAYTLAGLSSNTRGVMAGPTSGESASNTIQYITIASTGNASDFGDLATTLSYGSGVSDSTTGVFHCPQGNNQNVLEKITIATTGNASDFGDLTIARYSTQTGSTAHGGIDATALQAFAPAAIGLFAGGLGDGSPRYNTVIQYINIASTGNTVIFGDLSVGRDYLASGGFASSTRGVFAGGYTGADSDVIDFVTFSTKGKATDFGNLVTARYSPAAFSNSTRGIAGGGRNDASASNLNVIEYVTIASAGNTTDFGDLSANKQGAGGTASATRGIFHGGNSPGDINVIEYVTIASTGNATDFGDSGAVGYGAAGASSSTRGVFGGRQSSGVTNVIEYITIASTGNATDFGDLTVTKELAPAVSSGTRAVWGSGSTSSNVMDYITIASTGNAQDFGDMEAYQQTAGSASNSHGG